MAGLLQLSVQRLAGSRRLTISLALWSLFGFLFSDALAAVAVSLAHKSALLLLTLNMLYCMLIVAGVFATAAWLVHPDGTPLTTLGLPNGLSLLRAWVCLPMLYFAVLGLPGDSGFVWWAAVGMPVGYLDIVDGFIARRFGSVSVMGKALDPAVDALYFAFASLGATALHVMSPWIVALTLLRYLGPLLATPVVLLLGKRPELVHTEWGRRNTLFTGWVAVACVIVRATGHDAVQTSLIIGIPLLVPTTLLHFVSLWRRVAKAPAKV